MALNAHYFLKTGGHIVVSIKASCIDSTAAPEAVFQKEVRARPRVILCYMYMGWWSSLVLS